MESGLKFNRSDTVDRLTRHEGPRSNTSRGRGSNRASIKQSRFRWLLLFTFTITFSLPSSALSQPQSKRSLTVGIERNQKELQRIADMIDENRKEQSWILAGALADVTSIVTAGASKHVG